MAVWSQVKVRGRGLSLRPIGCTLALSMTQKAPLQLQLRLVALYKCYIRIPCIPKVITLYTVHVSTGRCVVTAKICFVVCDGRDKTAWRRSHIVTAQLWRPHLPLLHNPCTLYSR